MLEVTNDAHTGPASPKEVVEALKTLLRRSGSQREAAARLGVAPSTLSAQLSGASYLTPKIARRFVKAYGVNLDFLISGEGTLLPTEPAGGSIVGHSATISFEPGVSAEEIAHPSPDSSVNASLWVAVRSMASEADELRIRYLSILQSVEALTGMINKDSEEYTWAAAELQAMKQTKFGKAL